MIFGELNGTALGEKVLKSGKVYKWKIEIVKHENMSIGISKVLKWYDEYWFNWNKEGWGLRLGKL